MRRPQRASRPCGAWRRALGAAPRTCTSISARGKRCVNYSCVHGLTRASCGRTRVPCLRGWTSPAPPGTSMSSSSQVIGLRLVGSRSERAKHQIECPDLAHVDGSNRVMGGARRQLSGSRAWAIGNRRRQTRHSVGPRRWFIIGGAAGRRHRLLSDWLGLVGCVAIVICFEEEVASVCDTAMSSTYRSVVSSVQGLEACQYDKDHSIRIVGLRRLR